MISETGHDIWVKVGLTADEYVWLRDRAEALGLSQSALVRLLIRQERRSLHARHLRTVDHPADSAGAGQE